MQRRIGVEPIDTAADPIAFSRGSAAVPLPAATRTLCYRLTATDARSLEALRYARRAMLREEWTRGVETGEPSLGDAVFSAFEITWSVAADQCDRCAAKLAELTERANRALEELRAGAS